MNKTCSHCHTQFTISEEDLAFLKKVSPRINGATYQIPPPTQCPSCRAQRRMAHRNQIYVELQQDQATNERLFSMYLGKTPFPVISNSAWWSEEWWSSLDYGREFDFSRPFFEQWRELRDLVPRPALNSISDSMENSDYCNNCGWLKNCYLCFDADRSQDCMYVETLADCRDCVDCSVITDCELCYDCAGCSKCYNLQSSETCVECSKSYFLTNCRSCTECFGCTNLRRRTYCVYNEQLSKEEYYAFLSSLDLSSWKKRNEERERVALLNATLPHPHMIALRTENCTGNHIHNSRNITNSYFIHNAQDLRHCDIVKSGGKDCQDCTILFVEPELLYECVICGLSVSQLLFCYNCWDGARDLLYCDTSHGSKNCFGCVCLRKREYCILNKQYSREEYFALVPKIIEHMRRTGEWGEFFPMQLSPWPYNFTYASRYFPLEESQAKREHLMWRNKESVASSSHTPETLSDTLPDSDKGIVAQSEQSGRFFRITTEEIKRLRKFRAPLPRKAYDERMQERALRCGGITLRERQCAHSLQPLLSVYSEEEAPLLWDRDCLENAE